MSRKEVKNILVTNCPFSELKYVLSIVPLCLNKDNTLKHLINFQSLFAQIPIFDRRVIQIPAVVIY